MIKLQIRFRLSSIAPVPRRFGIIFYIQYPLHYRNRNLLNSMNLQGDTDRKSTDPKNLVIYRTDRTRKLFGGNWRLVTLKNKLSCLY